MKYVQSTPSGSESPVMNVFTEPVIVEAVVTDPAELALSPVPSRCRWCFTLDELLLRIVEPRSVREPPFEEDACEG
jgi:hypothetical protein